MKDSPAVSEKPPVVEALVLRATERHWRLTLRDRRRRDVGTVLKKTFGDGDQVVILSQADYDRLTA